MMTKPLPGVAAISDDEPVFTLRNTGDMQVTISAANAALRSWRAPDRYGRMADVLCAGADGPSPASWQGRHSGSGVSLLRMADGHAATLQVDYHLDDDGSLFIDQRAMAAVPTPLEPNPTLCFNLSGGRADAGDHVLQVDADYFVEVDAAGDPVGVAAVGGTPFDFRQPAPIGPRLRWSDPQTRLSGGFAHAFFVRNHFAGGQGVLREVASAFDPGSGRRLEMYTTEAAVLLCAAQRNADGFFLGAHAYPNLRSVAWPLVILQPGQVYRQTTVYRISLQD